MTDIEKIYSLFTVNPVISTDSRKIEQGCLFFALKGENFDGNKFAQSAIEKGAAYAIIDDKQFELPERTILVNNVLNTLQSLATLHRNRLGIPILAITGTNGKTTTKELVAEVLSEKFKVSYTQGNLNNHIGVPLTLLKMTKKTEFGVVEMGANHPGEIAQLCEIAKPDYGLITNIGKAHLEGFGSFEGVIQTKSELYDYLYENGKTAFYNKDNVILRSQVTKVRDRISYGTSDANLNGQPVYSPPFVHARVSFPKGVLFLNTRLSGDYNFENILAAACIGSYFGIDPIDIQHALKKYVPENSRSQLIVKDNLTIVMDAYNANPTSMSASIKSFLGMFESDNYLILGDMLELGEYSHAEHVAILNQLKEAKAKTVFLVGSQFGRHAHLFDFHFFADSTALVEHLRVNPIKKGNILIKGSRGIQLENVLDSLS